MAIPSFLLKENIVAKPGFNRWLVPPASVLIHLCIGSVYAWSVFNTPLSRELGVAAPAASDWDFATVVWIFSIAIIFLGLAAAIGGRWLEKVGPRCVGVTAAILWGGGFLVGALGIKLHSFPLLVLGYGALGGCGLGLGYVSPVSTLIRWFPDRRGMATGLAIMGFGGGAMIGQPLKKHFLGEYQVAPDQVAVAVDALTTDETGKRFANVGGESIEVVVATEKDLESFNSLAATGTDPLTPGVYAVGTGDTGTFATFVTLGLIYLVVMIIAAFLFRVPAADWKPAGWIPPAANPKKSLISSNSVGLDSAMKTPQFWFLWIVLCMNVTAGIGVIGVAKTMINEIFGAGFTDDSKQNFFFVNYVIMISVFNTVGRFFWASISDKIGRKTTYTIFFVLGCALYLSIPFAAANAGADATSTGFIIFYAATMIIFTMYGGGFATIPAYLADLFGTKFVGAIHGRLLTAWSTAGVLGPLAITKLRAASVNSEISGLVEKTSDSAFLATFGAGKDQLAKLVEAKTVTISKLMEIVPEGTIDPTPSLYNTTMYAMAALLVVGLFANLAIKPVDSRHHLAE